MLRIGEVIDKYCIEALIGQGGMAAVYRARHTRLDSLHAVKILFITAPSIRQRLLREGKVQANLRHPNIVAVTDVLEVQSSPALVMEYVDGPALDDWLNENRPTLAEAMFLFRGIVRGIMAAHERGVIHRDLKPANVMLAPTNEGVVPKVTDFGLVKSLSQKGKTQTGMAMGTPEYMAPEQIRDASDVDQRVDMFALGCMLYELVTHKRAFAGPDNVSVFNNIVSGSYPPPRKFVDDLPAKVLKAIGRLLEADREQRLSTCIELLDMLYDDDAAVGRLAGVKGTMAPISISQTLPEPGSNDGSDLPPELPPPLPMSMMPSAATVEADYEPTPAPMPREDFEHMLRPPVRPVRYIVPAVLILLVGMAVGSAFTALQAGRGPITPESTPIALTPEVSPPTRPPPEPEPEPPEPVPPEPEPPEPVPPEPVPPEPVPPAPAHVKAKPPKPPAPQPAGAEVSFSGDAGVLWLEGGGKRHKLPGTIPAGSYAILADFGDARLVAAGEVSLHEGDTVTLYCDSFLFQCRRR